MSKSDKLILAGEKRINLAEAEFTQNVKFAEAAILAEIQKLFEIVDVSEGKLRTNAKTTEFLLSIEDRIKKALTKSGYKSHVYDFLKNFDFIRQNNIDIQNALIGKSIPYSALNDITRLEVENSVNKLLGSGISRDFITPIKESLYRNITLGADIQEAQKSIRSYILTHDGKDSKLLKYTGQVARDSINQYDGAINKAIAVELDLKDYLYSGSLITDSRGQCKYWVEKTKLSGEELREEIKTALNNGTLNGHKCSGMVPGTTVDSFGIYRGGYNCRHRAIAFNI